MNVRTRSGSDGINQSSCSSIRSLPLSVLTLIGAQIKPGAAKAAPVSDCPPGSAGSSDNALSYGRATDLLFSRFPHLNRLFRFRFAHFTNDVAIAGCRKHGVR